MRDGGEVPPSKVRLPPIFDVEVLPCVLLRSSCFCLKVLHVRNLPADCTEQELVALCCPFGRVVNCLIIRVRQDSTAERR